jgi:leader peptidase (prepilin peptidase)/N-methyltransferase
LTEIATGALYAFLWYWVGRDGPIELFLLYTVYTTIFVLVMVIDLEHRLILNVVMYPAWGLALLGSLIHPTPHFYRQALVGGALGFGLLFLIYLGGVLFVKLWSKRRGKDVNAVAFGFGDVRLGLFIGLALGLPDVLPALFWAILLGGLGGVVVLLVQAIVLRRYHLFTAIPYGPFLIIGAMAVMLFS